MRERDGISASRDFDVTRLALMGELLCLRTANDPFLWRGADEEHIGSIGKGHGKVIVGGGGNQARDLLCRWEEWRWEIHREWP